MDLAAHLLPSRLGRAEHERGDYFHQPAPGVSLDQVLDPNYWVHLAERLRVNDLIEVVAPDHSFDLDLRVVAIDPYKHWAAVAPRAGRRRPATPLPAGPAANAQGYIIDNDPVQGWRILQGRDLIAHGFADEAAARAALADLKGPKPAKAKAAA